MNDDKRLIGHYILIGQTPVPEPDLMKWAHWFESGDRQVARTEIGASVVSTVFLGLDHNHRRMIAEHAGLDSKTCGGPLLFETMIFSGGKAEDYQERCSTWLEAERQHARAVAHISGDENDKRPM